MMNMLKFDPFFRDVDRLTQQLWRATVAGATASAPMDAWRDDDKFVIELDLPGIAAESLDVNVENGMLTVRAERPEPKDDRNWLVAERPYGTYLHRLTLGNAVDVDKITADYADGVLRLTIPVAEEAKPRKIAVVAADEPRQQAINA
ncbi:Hsp20/alpha crystallin family protein [Mycolicibacterium sp. XJ1819]